MLITQKMDSVHLSENEKQIRKYILEHEDETAALTVKELSGRSSYPLQAWWYLQKSWGFSGWNDSAGIPGRAELPGKSFQEYRCKRAFYRHGQDHENRE